MATPHQPLLTKTHKQNPIISFKILTFVITFFVALFLVVFLVAPYQVEIEHSNLCKAAQDSQLCLSYVSDLMSNEIVTSNSDGLSILKKFLVKYVHQMNSAIPVVRKIKNQINDIRQQGALTDCLELLDLSVDLVSDSIEAIDKRSRLEHANAQSWLSGVLTNHVTCLDSLSTKNGKVLDELITRAKVALAMLASVTTQNEDVFRTVLGKMPSWVSSRDRKLMESSGKDIKANAVVAQDGTGDYQTLAEAVAAAPDKSKTRYVIYVKMGIYKENVEVTSRKMNLMIVGDGMNATIITGSLNVVDGSTTFRSATLAAVGQGFILQDICIQNTAGPEKHQAVALRVGGKPSPQDLIYAGRYHARIPCSDPFAGCVNNENEAEYIINLLDDGSVFWTNTSFGRLGTDSSQNIAKIEQTCKQVHWHVHKDQNEIMIRCDAADVNLYYQINANQDLVMNLDKIWNGDHGQNRKFFNEYPFPKKAYVFEKVKS